MSDNGSQLVGAERELKEMIRGWNHKELKEFGAEQEMEWKFTTPGSLHQNGVAESLVKSKKKALKKAIHSTARTLSRNTQPTTPSGIYPENRGRFLIWKQWKRDVFPTLVLRKR